MRYSLIRDKKIFELGDHEIEVCDTPEEINNFSIKEIMNLLNELKEEDYDNIEIFVDIFSILKNLTDINSINSTELENRYLEKMDKEGPFSRYLLKIN